MGDPGQVSCLGSWEGWRKEGRLVEGGSAEVPLTLGCLLAGKSYFAQSCLWLVAGIIAKEPTSLEEEIKEIRRSGSGKALDTPEFELSDIFYFCRKGIETIMDDEVTKRFSAEELESWNLLSRTNYNFHYISLRLTVLWGLGVLIRYCFLLPLRWVLLQKPACGLFLVHLVPQLTDPA